MITRTKNWPHLPHVIARSVTPFYAVPSTAYKTHHSKTRSRPDSFIVSPRSGSSGSSPMCAQCNAHHFMNPEHPYHPEHPALSPLPHCSTFQPGPLLLRQLRRVQCPKIPDTMSEHSNHTAHTCHTFQLGQLLLRKLHRVQGAVGREGLQALNEAAALGQLVQHLLQGSGLKIFRV